MKKRRNNSPVANAARGLKAAARDSAKSYKEGIRSAPLTNILSAGAVGFILQLLPLGRIAAVLFRLFITLIKPTVLIFGAVKLFSMFAKGAKSTSKK